MFIKTERVLNPRIKKSTPDLAIFLPCTGMLDDIRKIRDEDYRRVKTLTPSQMVEYYRNKDAAFDDLIKHISRRQKKLAAQS